ncbi:MAG: DUF1826 domain-containing protein [Pseudomonadota bacterium]
MTTLLYPAARMSASADILNDVLDRDCNLAIWTRQENTALEALLTAPVEDVRFSAPLATLRARLDGELDLAGYPETAERRTLIDDIVDLAARYSAVMELEAVSVRLAIVTTDSCRKFHADYVKARLITTYVGTGTQWIDAEDTARVARAEEPQRVHTLGAGHVGLFKGKLSTEAPAIHRSPPIAGKGERRLMLVLDPVQLGRKRTALATIL